MSNPLAALVVPQGAERRRRRPDETADAKGFALVESVNPLRLSVNGETLEGTPVSLVAGLSPGDLVLTTFASTQLVVMGRVESEPGDLAKRRDNPPWRTPTLLNGWNHYTSFRNAEYRRVGDHVQFKGTVRDGTVASAANPIFFLDADCIPTGGSPLLTTRGGTTSVQDVRVAPSGALYLGTSTIPPWVTLESLSFFK